MESPQEPPRRDTGENSVKKDDDDRSTTTAAAGITSTQPRRVTMTAANSEMQPAECSIVPTEEDSTLRQISVCAVGDARVGKSALLLRAQGMGWEGDDEGATVPRETSDISPMMFESRVSFHKRSHTASAPAPLEGKIQINVIDHSDSMDGTELTDRMVTTEVLASQVILLCYRCDSQASLDSLSDHWVPLVVELMHKQANKGMNKYVVIVGNMSDRNCDPKILEAAAELTKEIGAAHNTVVSAKTCSGIDKMVGVVCGLGLASLEGCRDIIIVD